MSLLTVLRSPSSESTSICTDSELDDDFEDGIPRSRTSSFEGFFASKGSAFALPDGDFARKASKHGGEMQTHLQSMVNLLRDDDILRLVVKIEAHAPKRVRYLTVVSAFDEDDIEESIAMGVDWNDSKSGCTIGLVLPLLRDTAIKFDGDGGFHLSTNNQKHIIKPVSVQTMWTAVQWIHRCAKNARKNNQYANGQSHNWTGYYSSRISSDQSCINEWFEMEDVTPKVLLLGIGITKEQEIMMKLIRHKLKEVMMKVDLEEVTSRQIRQNLEEEMQMDLKEYKQYIDEEMLTIFGQLDYASQIYDHVYLGSEWNASNLEELKENGIGYILNISREVDNFFYGTFKYFNIRIYDDEDSELMPYWDQAYKFINEAKNDGSKVLVHCKMGMSRSASTVIAYGMKEYGMSLNDTMKYVKSKRSVINPNAGFWKQLITYEGILNSSKHRYNELFTSGRRRTNSADLEGRKNVRRRRNRRKNKSKTLAFGSKIEPEVIKEDSYTHKSERSVFSESDEDVDKKQIPSSSGCDLKDETLKDWEKTNAGSNLSSPNSSTESPDLSKELEDEVFGLVSTGKVAKQKSPVLHRAHSVPSLVGDASRSSDTVIDTQSVEGVHRCNSLREFLSGKVAALKKDYKEQTLGKHSNSLSSIENKQKSKSPSPEKESKENNTKVAAEKVELQSDLSDRTSSTSVGVPILISGVETTVDDKEDVGSVPDRSHNVVLRDAHIVVKSGTVKRQSRNFEEGKVNLPWEWEEALTEMSANENVESARAQEREPTSLEAEASADEEPPVGLVKLHAQKFQGDFPKEGKNNESADEGEAEIKNVSPDPEKAEPLFPSITSRKVIVVDSNSCPIVIEASKAKESESDAIKEEIQKARALFEKVNEEMILEKSKRRGLVNKRDTEIADCEERIDSSVSVDGIQECSEVFEDVKDVDGSGSPSEDPLPGTVLKHRQAIENKYRTAAATTSGVVDVEEHMSETTKTESQESYGVPKKVFIIQRSEENGHDNLESRLITETISNEKNAFDVDVLLRKVNENMKEEKQQRAAASLNDFKVCSISSEDAYIQKDVTPENENSDYLKQQGDTERNEIPRPGIVKRSTDLLLGKVRLENADKTQEEPAELHETGETNVREPANTSEKHLEILKAVNDDDTNTEDATEKSLVKRHTLVYEGKLPTDVEEEDLEELASMKTEKPTIEEQETTDDAVDSSHFMSVKLRLKLMEEVIQGANEREYHKQRMKNALAELEDKRERIEAEHKKIESDNVIIEGEKRSFTLDDGDDGVDPTEEKTKFSIASDEEVDPPEERAQDSETEEIKDSVNTDDSPFVGTVKLRTLILEERIHGSPENLSPFKPDTSLRRHKSMPRNTRPVDRPVVRQRSFSDLNTGSTPSTSKHTSTPNNRWSLDLRRDKNIIAKLVGSQAEDTPDNDQDSEKLSDDLSEKSDKTDDSQPSPTDIFNILKISKQTIQIPDLDNKDFPSL